MKKARQVFEALIILFIFQRCCASVGCGDSSIYLPFQLIDKTSSKDLVYDLGAVLNTDIVMVTRGGSRIAEIAKSDTTNGRFLWIQLFPWEDVLALEYKKKIYDLSIVYASIDSKCCPSSYVNGVSSSALEIAMIPNKPSKYGTSLYLLKL